MNELQRVFSYRGAQVRTVLRDGEPWFVAKDVCEALGYTWNGTARIEHVPEEWRGITSVVTPSGNQEMAIISEQGLYFFLNRSDKPNALPLQKWIAGEVIPSIRKHGAYMTPETIEKTLSDPDFIIGLATRLKTERAARIAAEEKVTELAPKAEFCDRVSSIEDTITIAAAAKILKTGEQRLFKFLRDSRILMTAGSDHNKPYQQYIDAGYFEVVLKSFPIDGQEHPYTQTRVTGRGMVWLERKWREANEKGA